MTTSVTSRWIGPSCCSATRSASRPVLHGGRCSRCSSAPCERACESSPRPPRAARFRCRAPRPTAPGSGRPARSVSVRGTETVLLVEDEEMIRNLVQKVLKANGYTVLVAASGRDAERVAGQHDGPIHLVVTDVVMPGMNGREVAQRLAAARPRIQVLYLSGYTDDA